MQQLLVFCSYATMQAHGEPSWVQDLARLTDRSPQPFIFYRPWLPLKDQPHVCVMLKDPHPFFVEHAKLLKLPAELLLPFEDPTAQSLLAQSDKPEPSSLLPFKDLYCLIRSHVLVSDLSAPSFGEVFQDVFYADLASIPIVGITSRFLVSPVMLNRLDTLVPASRVDMVARQLVSYQAEFAAISSQVVQTAGSLEEQQNGHKQDAT